MQNLLPGVGLVRNVHKVSQLRGIDFFILASNQHRSDTDQLQLRTLDITPLKEAINQVNGKEQRLWHALELVVDLDEPVNKNRTHLLIYISLFRCHEPVLGGMYFLLFEHFNAAVLRILCDQLRVLHVVAVDEAYSLAHIAQGVIVPELLKFRLFLLSGDSIYFEF